MILAWRDSFKVEIMGITLLEVLSTAGSSFQERSCKTHGRIATQEGAGAGKPGRQKRITSSMVRDDHSTEIREKSDRTRSSKALTATVPRSVHASCAAYCSVVVIILLLLHFTCFATLDTALLSSRTHDDISSPSESLRPQRVVGSSPVVSRHQEFNRKTLMPLVSLEKPAAAASQELVQSSTGTGGRAEDYDHMICRGKHIYIHNLPPEFNSNLVARCRYGITSRLNFCPQTSNHGLGLNLNSKKQRPRNRSGSAIAAAAVDDAFRHGWYKTDPYMLEFIFHSRLQSYPCRTSNASMADAFFIPYYARLDALRYSYNTTEQAETHGKKLVEWLKENAGDEWRRNGGCDHFMVLGRTSWDFEVVSDGVVESWGTGILSLAHMKNVTTVLLERNPWLENEQAVPYPTSFHPSSVLELYRWLAKVRSVERRSLFALAGATRAHLKDSIRSRLLQQCSESVACSLINCHQLQCSNHNPKPIMNVFLRSKFCLQPRGNIPTSRLTFDGMIAGCIPVFFHEHSAYTQYTLHFPSDRKSYSVYISEEQITLGTSIEAELLKFSEDKIEQMRETIVSFIPKLLYARHSHAAGFQNVQGDAFDTTIEGVLQKVTRYKEQLKLSSYAGTGSSKCISRLTQ